MNDAPSNESQHAMRRAGAVARPGEELEPITAEKVGMAYDRWADARRSELNLVIARQTAAWIEQRGEAQAAFGRVQALQGLATRLKQQS